MKGPKIRKDLNWCGLSREKDVKTQRRQSNSLHLSRCEHQAYADKKRLDNSSVNYFSFVILVLCMSSARSNCRQLEKSHWLTWAVTVGANSW